MDINELRQQWAKCITDARAILDKADAEKRDPTEEEEKQYDRAMEERAKLAGRIKVEDELQAEEKRAQESAGHQTTPDPTEGAGEQRTAGPRGSTEYRASFDRYLRGGLAALNAEEARALQVDVDTLGGFMVPPQQFVEGLIKALDDSVFIRALATKNTVETADSLGVVSLDADPADADWTTELATGGEDASMAFGKRQLHPHPLAKLVKVSNTLLRKTRGSAEDLVRSRLAYKFAVTEEKGFLTGSGAGQPLGIFTASAQGISTSRDVSTGNTATSIQFDGLQEALWSLKGTYRRNGRWLFHRDALKQIAKLKDGNGQYIWQMGNVSRGIPASLLDVPYLESEFAPNTFTTGLYVGIIGDFGFYWIADALSMTVQRLVELYAATNQAGFIGRLECDGMPVLEEAFARVKLA